MKKTFYYLAVMFFIISLNSCVTTSQYTDVTKRAKVEDVIKLTKGMDYKKINTVLQATPFNVYFLEEDGRSLWEYRYYTEDSYTYNTYKKENNWSKTYKSMYVLLKDGKLLSYITLPGIEEGYGIVITLNTINFCLTEKEFEQVVRENDDCEDGIIILVKDKDKFIQKITDKN